MTPTEVHVGHQVAGIARSAIEVEPLAGLGEHPRDGKVDAGGRRRPGQTPAGRLEGWGRAGARRAAQMIGQTRRRR